MNALLLVAIQNTIAALLLAMFVHALTRVVRNPPLSHLLWWLVLVKLVTPPVMAIHWPIRHSPAFMVADEPPIAELDGMPPITVRREAPQVAQELPTDGALNDDEAAGQAAVSPAVLAPPAPMSKTPAEAAGSRAGWAAAAPVVFWCWLGGTAVCAGLAAARIVRFDRAVRQMPPAPESIARLLLETADKYGVRRLPAVRCAQRVEVPLLWCVLRPTIVLPTRLTRELDERQVNLILAHELAHLRRHDHWLRLFELMVAIVYWWNPLVWLVRRQVHQAEELCCDAWVRWAFPEERKQYAEVVLKAAESLSALQVGRRPLVASPFLRCLSLKERIEMILESRFRPRVSLMSKFVIAVAALLVLPTFIRFSKAEPAQDKPAASASAAAAPPEAAHTSPEFPHIVKFEQGATKFLDGDKITILEVRGTAETFKPGEIYWIKGTYSLASHERASLTAYTTAKNAADGSSKSFTAQTTTVKKGSGTFTLFLPMACEGWPHVSFYPADGGEDFGGSYFGTGESVLKRWWGSKEATDSAKRDKAEKQPDGLHSMLLRELQQAKKELHVLRDETGKLSVEDASKFHAIAVDVDEPNTWRWRLFIPKGHRYSWNIACDDIPRHAAPSTNSGVMTGISNEPYWEHDNDVLVTAKLRPVTDKESIISVESRIGGSRAQMYGAQMKVPAAKLHWMSEDTSTDGQNIGDRGTEIRDPHGPVILLQRRVCERQPNGTFTPSDKPAPGFVIWLEELSEAGAKGTDAATQEDKSAGESKASRPTRRSFGRVTDAVGQPLAGVEIWAVCGGPTPGRAGIATSGEDGRYELVFNPALGPSRSGQPALQSTLISARKTGYFEENLNRQGGCVAASTMPDEPQLKKSWWWAAKDRVFLPDRPLEINFVMRPAAKAAGRLVDEQGQPLIGYSVALQGPDLSPGSSVASDARTDEQGRFALEGIPTTFRYQLVVRKGKPKPPWNDSWASAALRFDRTENDAVRAWFGDHEIRANEWVLRVVGEGVHGKAATRVAGNTGALHITAADPADVLQQSKSRLVAKSLMLTLPNAPLSDLGQSLVTPSALRGW